MGRTVCLHKITFVLLLALIAYSQGQTLASYQASLNDSSRNAWAVLPVDTPTGFLLNSLTQNEQDEEEEAVGFPLAEDDYNETELSEELDKLTEQYGCNPWGPIDYCNQSTNDDDQSNNNNIGSVTLLNITLYVPSSPVDLEPLITTSPNVTEEYALQAEPDSTPEILPSPSTPVVPTPSEAPSTTPIPIPVSPSPSQECIIQEHSNAQGSFLDSTFTANVSECCARCRAMGACNTFVYCPSADGCENFMSEEDPIIPYQRCDLKMQIGISMGADPVYYFRGLETEFISGFIESGNIGPGLSQDTCTVYKTDGPSQLAEDEGFAVMAPNGDNFLRVKTGKDCVTACEAVARRCNQPCCDSVTFNPSEGKCYLKVKGVKGDTVTNENGWQSFWRFEDLQFENYEDDDSFAIGSLRICPEDVVHKEYADAYVTLGVGQIAISEGRVLQMEDESYTKRFTSLVECALECQKLIECDAVTYSADSFTCLLRTGSQKFDTISSQFAETTYWRIPESRAEEQCKKKGWYCLYCGGEYGDTCEYF
eukprot:TRINITY_DN711_c0_g1_i1.p1 TRINITY_DN711_c0_g1~~TRINITY_DN711_c0_g1_i1.p1  ORF type:complete len:568 (-),score=50.71 TRINITY_DN711_c0_g1_i1:1050-2663(-)